MFTIHAMANKGKMMSVQVSVNEIVLGFQHNVLYEKLWVEVNTGLGNQDINSNFNDLVSGFGIGYNVFSNQKNQIAFNTGIGMYIPNNHYYKVTVPIVNAGLRYTCFIGKKDKHCFLASVGYRYGKREYHQEFKSEIINVSTIGTFKVSPVCFSVGYGYRF